MHSYLIFPPLAKPSHRKPHAGNGHHTDTQVAQTDLTAVLQSINQAGCGGSRISPSVSYIVGGSIRGSGKQLAVDGMSEIDKEFYNANKNLALFLYN